MNRSRIILGTLLMLAPLTIMSPHRQARPVPEVYVGPYAKPGLQQPGPAVPCGACQ
jgi:hypothetical protein